MDGYFQVPTFQGTVDAFVPVRVTLGLMSLRSLNHPHRDLLLFMSYYAFAHSLGVTCPCPLIRTSSIAASLHLQTPTRGRPACSGSGSDMSTAI